MLRPVRCDNLQHYCNGHPNEEVFTCHVISEEWRHMLLLLTPNGNNKRPISNDVVWLYRNVRLDSIKWDMSVLYGNSNILFGMGVAWEKLCVDIKWCRRMTAGALCEINRSSSSLYIIITISQLMYLLEREKYQDIDITRPLWIIELEKKGLSSRLMLVSESGRKGHILTVLSICQLINVHIQDYEDASYTPHVAISEKLGLKACVWVPESH